MKHIIIFTCVAALLIAGFACSGNSSNSAESNNANVAESQFAYITDADVALAEGNRLLDDNQTETAIEAFRQAVKLNPDLAEAYFKMGIAYALVEMEMQQTSATADPLTNADGKRLKTNSEKAFEKAVEAYKKWIDANPNDDAAFYNLGRTYNKLNQDEQAEKSLRQAAKLKSDDSEYQTELGAILMKLAKYHEAIGPLRKAFELDPSNTRAEEMLDEAIAGAKRLDYVGVKTNANQANSNANVNANVNANSNSNSAPKPPDGNTKPPKNEGNVKKPGQPANKPK